MTPSAQTIVEQLQKFIADSQGKSLSRYQLTIEGFRLPISIHSLRGQESLDQPWHYLIDFTCAHPNLQAEQLLNRPAQLDFVVSIDEGYRLASSEPQSQWAQTIFSQYNQSLLSDPINALAQLTVPIRTLYGVVTQFNRISSSADETRYQVQLSSRLARLDQRINQRIFQRSSVIEVVEQLLRQHHYTGIHFEFRLRGSYPKRELISQWQESDLQFIRRILADVGIWFRFESDSHYHCERVIFGDSENGYGDTVSAPIRSPSGLNSGLASAVWDLQVRQQIVAQQITVNDYNYRTHHAPMQQSVNSQPADPTTYAEQYQYGDNYREAGGESAVTLAAKMQGEQPSGYQLNADGQLQQTTGSGEWFAQIRHQRQITMQIEVSGSSNLNQLTVGEILQLQGAQAEQLEELTRTLLITEISAQGSREQPHQLTFKAVPFSLQRPYRPALLPWPQVAGTITGRITSAHDDIYGYLDQQGRYRVKFHFDPNQWRAGEESMWLRLARPYSGAVYGMHFPLIDGTTVAIAFTDGNPDRPYIAHALHDSAHPDLVTLNNKQRNVIRTPTNNKLRMEDKRGQEHIKLATEYGKSQLNLGHLVNSERQQRGQGFELRTDDWGAIRAGKGLFISTYEQNRAVGEVLHMNEAIQQLEKALEIAKSLQRSAQESAALPADDLSQQALQQNLSGLAQPGMLTYAQSGSGVVSPENIQLSAGKTLTFTAGNQTDISVLKKITLAAGEAISLFARTLGIKIFAAKGKVEIEAQSDAMAIMAKQDLQISSSEGKTTITAGQEINLVCGGAYIKISESGVEVGTPQNVLIKAAGVQKMGAGSQDIDIQLDSACSLTESEAATSGAAIVEEKA